MKIKKINKTLLSIIVLSVLLAATMGYVIFDIVSEAKLAEQQQIYQEGAAYGYELAISEISRLAGSCQKVPLTYMNQTIELADLSCLQAQQ